MHGRDVVSDRVDVEVDGYRVRVHIDGNSGPVVVLCSGLGGRQLHWRDTVADLARDHTVVRFDRPGTPVAGTPALNARRTVRGEAARIAAVLDAVGQPNSAVVVGHSVAGFYTEGFARLYPDRARALLLLDSSIAPDHPLLALPGPAKLAAADAAAALLDKSHLRTALGRAGLTLLQRRRPGGLDARARYEIRSTAADPGLVTSLLTEYAAYHELAAELCALRADRPLPPVPRMVVTAHRGWRTQPWRARQIRLAAALGAEHETIAPAGHLVMIEQPLRTADVIRRIGRSATENGAATSPRK